MNDVVIQQDSLQVTVAMPAAVRSLLDRARDECAVADLIVIESAGDAQVAADEMNAYKQRSAQIEAEMKKVVEPAMQIITTARGWFQPTITLYREAEANVKRRLIDYRTQEEERVRRERVLADAAARKAQQEAEQKAAAERAQAEETARQERQRAADLERQRQAAVEAGNQIAASAAAAEAAAAQERAQAVLENAQQTSMQLQLEAQASVPAVPDGPVKIDGFTTRENFKARLRQGVEEENLPAMLIEGITGIPRATFVRPELMCLLEVDWTALHKLAKAQKKSMNVPGVEAYDARIAAGSRK
jgi:hypothetical protein